MALTIPTTITKGCDDMILWIIVTFIFFGIWLQRLNKRYAGIDPLFQSSFVCYTAAAMLLGGAWTAGGQFTLESSFNIIFPLYLMLLYFLVVLGVPTYTYEEACRMIETETGATIIEGTTPFGQHGYYYCYTQQGCYLFDAATGDYFIDPDAVPLS